MFSSGGPSVQFLARYDGEVSEPLVGMGKTEGRRRRGQQRMKWLDGITDSVDVSLLQESAAVHVVSKSETQVGN